MKKWIILYLLSLLLTGCITMIKSDNEYQISGSKADFLPPATIGKPYQQIIHIYGSVPRTIWPRIYTKDSGLQLRILWSDPNKKVISNHGNIIEINGIPKNIEKNRTNKSYISLGIIGYGHEGRFDNDLRAEKRYYIELLPEKTNKSNPTSSSNK